MRIQNLKIDIGISKLQFNIRTLLIHDSLEPLIFLLVLQTLFYGVGYESIFLFGFQINTLYNNKNG